MEPNALVECVPNFSEGRDTATIEAIASSIRATDGVLLLDVDPGAETNRTVYTFVGSPTAVLQAALAAAKAARSRIDMRRHSGAHPRLGALDVCPFVPVRNVSMDECVALSREFGARLASELGVPVYLYDHSAATPSRESLAAIRDGEYEGLESKLSDPEWKPDFGEARLDPRWGATVTGAREFLLAYNVNLNTKDRKMAQDIALSIREGGRVRRDAEGNPVMGEDGQPLKVPGRFKGVRAIGWYIGEYRRAQVSVNILDFRRTPLHQVFEAVRQEAEQRGLVVTGSELVGLAPLDALLAAGRHYLERMGRSPGLPEAELVEVAIQSLGLDSVAPFEPAKKIVEWACAAPGGFSSMELRRFTDEVSSDSPAPGGGSAAALAGSLGAALAAMAANLGYAKKGLEGRKSELAAMAAKAQELKGRLLELVQEDTSAYNAVLAALRLPKGSDAQRAYRARELAGANLYAARVPLRTAKLCLEAARLCSQAMSRGNPSSATDAAVGGLLALAGLEGAALNVKVNLQSGVTAAEDAAAAAALLAETEALLTASREMENRFRGVAAVP